ncbi:lipocalin [Maritimibacter sp. HL-12]|uniref:lipocalin n=1 Tax=Maritimibacter sp. HL-12 TaxID=1162418 RepID=UPI000A0EF07D|nr:lipocalin [Maritimibacter sp. HL-12]SMH33113.1 apolipoprotein D and lipocalin family protein [Maritimibacter sp. HL-12]
MRRLILAATLALAACGEGSAPPDAARMTSLVGFEPAGLVGTWHEVAAIGRPPGASWQVDPGPGGALAISTSRDGAGQAEMVGPGRLRLSQFASPLWVLWADADMRTLVMGTPDGRIAIVLDRAARAAPDRLAAAREVLDWNGYDLAALRR